MDTHGHEGIAKEVGEKLLKEAFPKTGLVSRGSPGEGFWGELFSAPEVSCLIKEAMVDIKPDQHPEAAGGRSRQATAASWSHCVHPSGSALPHTDQSSELAALLARGYFRLKCTQKRPSITLETQKYPDSGRKELDSPSDLSDESDPMVNARRSP